MKTLTDITSDLCSPWGSSAPPAGPASVLGALVHRPTLYRRNGVAWLSARSWRADAKAADIQALRSAKKALPAYVLLGGAQDVADAVRQLTGPLCATVTAIPCGHSCRPDCFGKRLAQAVAAELTLPFIELFEDRYRNGVSHPKEFAKLPPLTWRSIPTGPMLVVDDVATSGWHMEEALKAIRARGLSAIGAVWISGTVA